ncbi:AAA family ATPase [Desulfofundulus sp. TPOSR]|jgi:CO dehydrogenase maturation factor|uniref:Cobyrinic acid ac-diamide synthase n=1 Tax=Desulfofundulus kuznetsovii (strain DSM 6115 / VKM B-1805 / 17) TaxID=760568 RepID=A0AAU8PMS8_DESK7|nr:carbon monoxide dehydrogenase accessory protein CooC [Desulfofundulus sp. TPOSR]AEG15072.1 Cobyrinic acid ac-diamide synthase [Desulfofundulus kuznetsovii DSM 6115]NHM25484.1 AAA family ATPase [Desulfofundulus sp. TPOSR]
MAFTIAIAGKGGTGKTTLAALLIRQLIQAGKGPILAVDADANANLHEALGIEVEDTIANIMARINNNLEPLPAGMTKDQYVAFRVHQSLAEGDEVDLLVMGGPEGPGCYCYVNNLVRGFMQELSNNYPFVVMDNEAGLEHLSRRTTQNVDILFVTSDASARGIRSAGRVKELVESLALEIKKMYLVVTKVNDGSVEALQDEIQKTGLELIGAVPRDEQVFQYDLQGKPLVELPDDSLVVAAVTEIMRKTAIL